MPSLDAALEEAATVLYGASFPNPYQLNKVKHLPNKPPPPFQLTCHLPGKLVSEIARGNVNPPAERAGHNADQIALALWEYVTDPGRVGDLAMAIRNHTIGPFNPGQPASPCVIRVNLNCGAPPPVPVAPLPDPLPGIVSVPRFAYPPPDSNSDLDLARAADNQLPGHTCAYTSGP